MRAREIPETRLTLTGGVDAAQREFDAGVSATDVQAWGAARDRFRAAVKLEPELPAAYANLAVCYRNLGDLDAAEEPAARACELSTRSPRELADTCRFLLGQLRLERAKLPEWFDADAFRLTDVQLRPLRAYHVPVLFEQIQFRDTARLVNAQGLARREAFEWWIERRWRGTACSRSRAPFGPVPSSSFTVKWGRSAS